MIVFEVTEDKFGKLMKSVSEIMRHSECLLALFEDISEDSEFGNKMNRRHEDDDMYGSRYVMRHSGRRPY